MTDTNALIAAFNVLEADGGRLADPETGDPHEEDERAVSPGGQLCKKGLEILFRNDIRYPLRLAAIQALTPPPCFFPSLKWGNRIVLELSWIEQIQFSKQ